jgi:hypothetical protein
VLRYLRLGFIPLPVTMTASRIGILPMDRQYPFTAVNAPSLDTHVILHRVHAVHAAGNFHCLGCRCLRANEATELNHTLECLDIDLC